MKRSAQSLEYFLFPSSLEKVNNEFCFISTLLHSPSVVRYNIFSRFYVIFPAFRGFRGADSMYVYHYTLAFEPDFVLEQSSTLNSGCL